jgi:hypothetical protein
MLVLELHMQPIPRHSDGVAFYIYQIVSYFVLNYFLFDLMNNSMAVLVWFMSDFNHLHWSILQITISFVHQKWTKVISWNLSLSLSFLLFCAFYLFIKIISKVIYSTYFCTLWLYIQLTPLIIYIEVT